MIRNVQNVMGCSIGATDGEVGEVADLYFDDQQWTIRYLVVETGAWLYRRKVLVSPQSIGRPDWDRKLLPASITTEQVRHSPEIDTNKPVSRQHETLFLNHYRYPRYWESAGALTVGSSPTVQPPDSQFGWSDEHLSRAIAAREHHTEYGVPDSEDTYVATMLFGTIRYELPTVTSDKLTGYCLRMTTGLSVTSLFGRVIGGRDTKY